VFAEMEGLYGRCMNKVRLGLHPSKEQMFSLLLMTFDVKLRNAAQKNETPHEDFSAYTVRALLFLKSMLLGLAHREPRNGEAIDHLTRFWKVRILKAAPGTEFLTSDNPSIWIVSKGEKPTLEMTVLPLTPDRIAVAYDKRRKKVFGKHTSAKDQEGFVRLQCRNSMRAVYCSQQLTADEEKFVNQCITERNNPGTINETRWEADFIRLGEGVFFDFAKDVGSE